MTYAACTSRQCLANASRTMCALVSTAQETVCRATTAGRSLALSMSLSAAQTTHCPNADLTPAVCGYCTPEVNIVDCEPRIPTRLRLMRSRSVIAVSSTEPSMITGADAGFGGFGALHITPPNLSYCQQYLRIITDSQVGRNSNYSPRAQNPLGHDPTDHTPCPASWARAVQTVCTSTA